ncbi:hypothetical protein [Aquimarina sp. AU474]|uniref:hypothetical protein n=1 Tax=Aquimarina sp. AU474 TaxID=2108529 RepID=UPI000D69B566|nr:hypothetical protein [Aquimarina sp. AU474]
MENQSIGDLDTLTKSKEQSKNCSVTNNSSQDVVVVLPIAGQTPGPDNSATVVKGLDLEVLNTTDGTAIIAKDKSASVVLDMMYKDSDTGEEKWSSIYDLIISSSSWYMPVANHSASAILGPFEPVTASSDDETAMQQAATFYQTIIAYPNSKLASDYVAAMKQSQTDASSKADGSSGSSQNVADSLSDSVQKFFEGTKEFKKVTLPVLVAMEDYYRDFSFVWSQYKSTTYNIYKSNGDQLGKVTFTKPDTIDVTKDNGGYTITYTSSDEKTTKNLIYSDSLFVDDVNSDTPSIALKGTFQLKGVVNATSDATMITMLTGVIGADTCLGVDFEIKKDSKGNPAWYKTDAFQEFMAIGGLAMFAMLALGPIKWIYGKCFGKKAPTTEEQFKKMQDDIKASLKEEIDTAVKKISDGKGEVPDNPADALEEMGASKGRVQAAENAGKIQEGLESEANTLEQLAEFEGDMTPDQLETLESNASDLKEIQDALDNAQFKDLPDVVKAQTEKMGDLKSNINDFVEEVQEHLSAEAKAQIAENKATSDKLVDEVNESQQEQEEEASQDGEDVDPIEPVE